MEQVQEVGREPEIVQRQTEFSNNLEEQLIIHYYTRTGYPVWSHVL